jgi:hypothetical protein
LENIKKYNHKTIAISETNYSTLQELGKTGMSFNDVLDSILKSAAVIKCKDLKGLFQVLQLLIVHAAFQVLHLPSAE